MILAALAAALGAAWVPLGRTPSGDRLERIKRSPNYRDGAFHNLSATPMMTSGKSRWNTMWEFLFAPKPAGLAPKSAVRAVRTDLTKLDRQTDRFVWFGHSSYLLINGGSTFLVDPVLTSRYPTSLMMKPFKGSDIYTPDDIPPVDYLIITHDHYDHLDYATVKALKDRIGCVICPLGVGEHFAYWGYPPESIIELDWDESVTLPTGQQVTCLPARHFSGRFLRQNPTLWASFMLQGSTTAYIGGDSGYGPHFAEIGRRFPRIDVAMIEDGQYNEDWKYIHTLPEQLDSVIRDLSPRIVIPVHNGKFALSRHPWDEPLAKIKQLADTTSDKDGYISMTADTAVILATPVIGLPIDL